MHCRLTDNKNLIFLSYLPSAFSPTTGSVWKTQISKDYHYDVPLQMQWWHLFAHNCLYCVKLTSCSCKTSQRPCPTLLHESRYTCYSCTYRTVSILQAEMVNSSSVPKDGLDEIGEARPRQQHSVPCTATGCGSLCDMRLSCTLPSCPGARDRRPFPLRQGGE